MHMYMHALTYTYFLQSPLSLESTDSYLELSILSEWRDVWIPFRFLQENKTTVACIYYVGSSSCSRQEELLGPHQPPSISVRALAGIAVTWYQSAYQPPHKKRVPSHLRIPCSEAKVLKNPSGWFVPQGENNPGWVFTPPSSSLWFCCFRTRFF